MNDIDRLLLGQVLDALEPGEARRAARLAADPAHAARLAELRALAVPPTAIPPTWRLPPPRFGLGMTASAAAVFGRACRAGDLVDVRVSLPDDRDRVVIVLWRVGDLWTQPSGAPVPTSAFGRDGDALLLHVVAPDPAGPHRFAVALPLAATLAGSGAVHALRTGIADGTVPVGTWDLDVST